MISRSPIANEIANYLKKINGGFCITGIIPFDGKMFLYQVYIHRRISMPYVVEDYMPPVIYEFDYEKQTIKYAGYLKNFDAKRGMEKTNLWMPGEYRYGFNYHGNSYLPIEFMAKIVKTN